MKKTHPELADFLSRGPTSRWVPTPEGTWTVVFHPRVAEWVSRRLTADGVREIRDELAPRLRIPLTAEGFALAADRRAGSGRDPTHYDTVWVRDAMWVFFGLRDRPERRADARRLLLAVWDYYATPAQLRRFAGIIARPGLARDMMRVPRIRFDLHPHGPGDVLSGGRPEVWNHKQNDAHGLFLIALAAAVREGLIVAADLEPPRAAVLVRFPAFFHAIRFETWEDAGAWEELERRNTSSVGLVSRALEAWRTILHGRAGGEPVDPFRGALSGVLENEEDAVRGAWREEALDRLAGGGLATVRRQLALGGESPDYDPGDIRFRGPDAALLTLLVPEPPEGLGEGELRQALGIVETLVGPAGVLRYRNDSYQSGNSWLRPRETGRDEAPGPDADESLSTAAFRKRGEKMAPGTEAQWFFDSLICLARFDLAAMTRDERRREIDRFLAVIHLKRALGQLTGTFDGTPPRAADGEALETLLPPESINTVVREGRTFWLPSPITPLNWARAALDLALGRAVRELPPR